tara:strand:- start:969 stop:1565 length:597 start_codon:yes stop_codon:yes gene_type:complete
MRKYLHQVNQVLISDKHKKLYESKIMAKKPDDKKPKLKLVSDNKNKPDKKRIGYNPENKVTAKQEAFLQDIASGKTLIQSYKDNYGVKPTTSDKVISINASRLFNSTSCSLRYKAILRSIEEQNLTRAIRREEYVLKKLTEEIEQGDQASNRIKALQLLGSTINMFGQKLEVENKQTEKTSEEITEELKDKLSKLLAD